MSKAGCETSAAEAAIEAWVSCQPQGYVLEEHRLPELLPLIALKVPNTSPETYNRMLEELFVCQGESPPLFATLLQPRAGRVHFLSFWKAFSKAVHMANAISEEILLSELETVRDRILHMLSKASHSRVSSAQCVNHQESTISIATLAAELQHAASMSAEPCFWHEADASLSEHLKVPALSIEEVSNLLLLWLIECVHWEHMMEIPSVPDDSKLLAQGQCFNPFKEAWDIASNFGSLAKVSSNKDPQSDEQHLTPWIGHTVYIHVYDVSQEEGIQKLNKVLAHASSPLKFGGVFHAGVEVNGLEWSFAYQPHTTRYGVECNHPKSHPQHHFRQTIKMGSTRCSDEEITTIMAQMVEEYPGNDYDLLRRNCCHFADDLCHRLGVGSIPSWIYRLARIGAGVAAMREAAQSFRTQMIDQLHKSKSECEPTGENLYILSEVDLVEYDSKYDYLLTLKEAEFEME